MKIPRKTKKILKNIVIRNSIYRSKDIRLIHKIGSRIWRENVYKYKSDSNNETWEYSLLIVYSLFSKFNIEQLQIREYYSRAHKIYKLYKPLEKFTIPWIT